MNNLSTNVDASQSYFSQNGRKGISYDWQSLYAAEAASIDCEHAALAPRWPSEPHPLAGAGARLRFGCAVHRSAAAA